MFGKISKNTLLKSSTIAVTIVFLCIVLNVSAYENNQRSSKLGGGAHRVINNISIRNYLTTIAAGKEDKAFAQYDFEPLKPDNKYNVKPLNKDVDPKALGTLFMPAGKAITARVNKKDASYHAAIKKMKGTFTSWVIEGGFSADEPEYYMSLRHFYNPVSSLGPSYLTDLPKRLTSTVMGESNPCIDAVTWALNHNENEYCWEKGNIYLDNAFLSKDINATREAYAAAWRSMGEVMHLISDMSVPAHVRNDSHPGNALGAYLLDGLRADSYEYLTNSDLSLITNGWRTGLMDAGLLKDIQDSKDPGDIFEYVATHVNKNFYSSDTIPYDSLWYGKATNNAWNGEGIIYSLPDPKSCIEEKHTNRFYMEDFPGEKLFMYETSWLDDDGWDDVPPKTSISVVKSQARRLVPIAVNASTKIMQLFIPKVTMKINEVVVDEKSKDPTIKGRLDVYKRDSKGLFSTTPEKSLTDSVQSMLLFVYVTGKDKKQKELIYMTPPVEVKNSEFEISLEDVTNEDGLYDILHPKEGELSNSYDIKYAVGLDMGGILVKSEVFGGDDITGIWEISFEMGDVKIPDALLDANAGEKEKKQYQDSIKSAFGAQLKGMVSKSTAEITKLSGNDYMLRYQFDPSQAEIYKASGVVTEIKITLSGNEITSQYDMAYGQAKFDGILSSDNKTMDGELTSNIDMSKAGAGKVEYFFKWHAVKVK